MSIESVMPSSIIFLLCLTYILNFTIGIIYRKKHSIDRVWCHSWSQATTDGLSMYPLWIRGDYCNPKSSRLRQQNYFTVSVGQKSRCCFAGSSCSGFLGSLHSHCPLGCQPSQGSTRGGSVLKLTRVAVGRIQVLGLVALRVYETYHSTSSKHGPWLLSGPARAKAGESGQDAC